MKDNIKIWEKYQEAQNKKDFFDGFMRMEQKSRLKGHFPTVDNLIRLDNYLQTFLSTYGDIDEYKELKLLIETTKKLSMEYSISIDGSGRAEFIKAVSSAKEEKEDEREKDLLDRLAEKLG